MDAPLNPMAGPQAVVTAAPSDVSTVNAPPSNAMVGQQDQPASPDMSAQSVAQTPAPVPTPEQQAQQAQSAHDSLTGRAFKILSGQDSQYSVDPATGKTVVTHTPNPPGQFFKNIVAAALVGGAAGADHARQNAGSPLAAVAQGGTAQLNRDQQMNQDRIQQAQQQYQNQLKAQTEQREQAKAQQETQESSTKQTLLKAQIAGENLRQFQEAARFENQTHEGTINMADKGKVDEQPFIAIGAKPSLENVTSDQLQKFISENKGAVTDYKAVPVDAKYTTITDANGQPHASWENTYNVYKLDQPLPVTSAMLSSDKYKALKTENPNAYDVIKKNVDANGGSWAMPLNQYLATSRQADLSLNAVQTRTKANQSIEDIKSQIKERNAAASNLWAETGLKNLEKQTRQLSLDDQKLVDAAEPALLNGGRNPDGSTMNLKQVTALDKYYTGNFSTAVKAFHDLSTESSNDPTNKELQTQAKAAGQLVGSASDQLTLLNTTRQKLGLTAPTVQPPVQMFDLGGNPVSVPADRVNEATKAGYKPAPSGAAPTGTREQALDALDKTTGLSEADRKNKESNINKQFDAHEAAQAAQAAQRLTQQQEIYKRVREREQKDADAFSGITPIT